MTCAIPLSTHTATRSPGPAPRPASAAPVRSARAASTSAATQPRASSSAGRPGRTAARHGSSRSGPHSVNGFGPTGSAGAVDGSCPRVGSVQAPGSSASRHSSVWWASRSPGTNPAGRVSARRSQCTRSTPPASWTMWSSSTCGVWEIPKTSSPNQSVAAGPSPVSPRPLVNTTGCAGAGSPVRGSRGPAVPAVTSTPSTERCSRSAQNRRLTRPAKAAKSSRPRRSGGSTATRTVLVKSPTTRSSPGVSSPAATSSRSNRVVLRAKGSSAPKRWSTNANAASSAPVGLSPCRAAAARSLPHVSASRTAVCRVIRGAGSPGGSVHGSPVHGRVGPAGSGARSAQ